MIQITVFEEGESLGTGAYAKNRLMIGSAEGSDLKLEAPGILAEHVSIFVEEGKAYARPADGAEVEVNGTFISDRLELKPTDLLRVAGALDLRVTTQEQQAPRGRSTGRVSFHRFRDLVGENTSNAGRSLDLTKSSEDGRRPAPQPEEDDEPSRLAAFVGGSSGLIKAGLLFLVCVVAFMLMIYPTIAKMYGWNLPPEKRLPSER